MKTLWSHWHAGEPIWVQVDVEDGVLAVRTSLGSSLEYECEGRCSYHIEVIDQIDYELWTHSTLFKYDFMTFARDWGEVA